MSKKREKKEVAPIVETQVRARELTEEEIASLKSSQRGMWTRPEYAGVFHKISELKPATGMGVQIDGIPAKNFKLSLATRVKKNLEGDFRYRVIDETTVAVFRVS